MLLEHLWVDGLWPFLGFGGYIEEKLYQVVVVDLGEQRDASHQSANSAFTAR